MGIIFNTENPEEAKKLKEYLSPIFRELLSELSHSQSPPKKREQFLTPKEVASMFKVTTETVSDWVKADRLPGFHLGGRLYFIESEIIDAAKKLKIRRRSK